MQQALSDIKSLTFYENQEAVGRRSTVPQLDCIGGNAKEYYSPRSITCKNLGGHNEDDLSWSCTADLPVEFKLGSTDVSCEGWSGPSDRTHITQGSCGVQYTLWLTDEGEARYGANTSSSEGGTFASAVFLCFFAAVLGFIIYSMYQQWNRPANPAHRRRRPVHRGPHDDGDAPDDPFDNNNNHHGYSGRNLGLAATGGLVGASLVSRQQHRPPSVSHSNSFASSTGFGSTSMR